MTHKTATVQKSKALALLRQVPSLEFPLLSGHGDVFPVTAWGKFAAGIVALTSIAIVAMPTGIMAAAFSDAFQRVREDTGTRHRD